MYKWLKFIFIILFVVILNACVSTNTQDMSRIPEIPEEIAAPSVPQARIVSPLQIDSIYKQALFRYQNMTDQERIAQTMIIRINTEKDGMSLTKKYRTIITEFQPGGIILFGNNIINVQQTQHLINSIQTLNEIPMFVSADIEGGKVNRFRNTEYKVLSGIPSAHTSSNIYSPSQLEQYSYFLGKELRNIGINMNFAPVVDVRYEQTPVFLQERIYGDNPEETLQYGMSVVQGLQQAGVLSVAKHFPGHGGASGDTHYNSAVVTYGYDTLYNNDWYPYRGIIQKGVSAIMLGHMYVPAIDNTRIASMSSKVIEVLTKDLGFQGLVLTDSLKMKAVLNEQPKVLFEVEALNVGVDILLDPSSPTNTLSELEEALQEGILNRDRLKEAVMKILAYKIYYLNL